MINNFLILDLFLSARMPGGDAMIDEHEISVTIETVDFSVDEEGKVF